MEKRHINLLEAKYWYIYIIHYVGNLRVILIDSLKACGLKPMVCDDDYSLANPDTAYACDLYMYMYM